MMKKATSLAWRPKNFTDLKGQEYITSVLSKQIQQGNISHGYLFTGPRGVGKTSLARILAKALNCKNLHENGDPCNACESCLAILEERSLDVIEIDAASFRGIDQIRKIKQNTTFLPQQSEYKVYIIDEVHMLTTEAFNSILKILEEPPAYVVFILATTEIHKVKDTVRSRCQVYQFHRFSISQIQTHLSHILDLKEIPYQEKAIERIAQMAQGSMRDAQTYLDQFLALSDEAELTTEMVESLHGIGDFLFLDLMEAIAKQDFQTVERIAKEIYHSGMFLGVLAESLLNIVWNLLLLHQGKKQVVEESATQEKLEELKEYFLPFVCYQFTEHLFAFHQYIREATNEWFFLQGLLLKMYGYPYYVDMQTMNRNVQGILQQHQAEISYVMRGLESLSHLPEKTMMMAAPAGEENSLSLQEKSDEFLHGEERSNLPSQEHGEEKSFSLSPPEAKKIFEEKANQIFQTQKTSSTESESDE